MVGRIPRKIIVEDLKAKIDRGEPIIGCGAGTGISGKFAEAGGTDLIIIYNSGRFRMDGRGSLAGLMSYGDANAIVLEMAHQVIPVIKKIPVLAGVHGTDPYRDMEVFIKECIHLNFSGVQNFPTVGLIDGVLRKGLEETDMGYYKEVEMIATAHKLDMFTSPYVFNEKNAEDMVDAGADMIVAHMGLTARGEIGAKTYMSLDDAAKRVQSIRDAGVKINPEVMCLCHGGPIAEPSDADYVMKHTEGVAGFFGASSIERLPTEKAIKSQVEQFKKIRMS